MVPNRSHLPQERLRWPQAVVAPVQEFPNLAEPTHRPHAPGPLNLAASVRMGNDLVRIVGQMRAKRNAGLVDTKDGAWTIPKYEFAANQELFLPAQREVFQGNWLQGLQRVISLGRECLRIVHPSFPNDA
jgi:hypothetical protein